MKRRMLIGWGLFFALCGAVPETLALPPLAPAVASPAAAPAAPPALGLLRWKNGETLPGEIAAASADELDWKTPYFEDPFKLRWDVIDRIDWSPTPAPPAEDFGIALRDGSFIYADLLSINADSVAVHSARHGDTLLKRSEVLIMRRMPHDSLLYSGPLGEQGWTAMSNQPDGSIVPFPPAQTLTPPLATGPGGSLSIQAWNRSAFLQLILPDSFDVEFRVRSSRRPQFLLGFGGNLANALRVETWDNTLVLTEGNRFKIIRKIEDDQREVALRVLWDKEARVCRVYTPAGEPLAEWDVPDSADTTEVPPTGHYLTIPVGAAGHAAGPAALKQRIVKGGADIMHPLRRHGRKPAIAAPGVILQNRGLDLALDFLRVRTWDGKSLPTRIDDAQPRLELDDGQSVSGQITSAGQGMLNLQPAGQAAAVAYPIAKVDALMFSPDAPQVSDHEVMLCYNDGATVRGHIASIADGKAALATSFTAAPFSSRLEQLRQLVMRVPGSKSAPPPADLASMDKISFEQTTLHGKFSFSPDGALRWMPIGGTQAAAPSRSLPSEITLAALQQPPPPSDTALFYLGNGDVLPGSLKSIDRTGAEFASSIMDARKLPPDELDAIEFSPAGPSDEQGFGDPPWRILKGDDKTVHRKDTGIQLDAGAAIFSPTIMQSSEIRFKIVPSGFSCTRLRMFCSATNSTHAYNFLLGTTGNQLVAGIEAGNGQFENQSQTVTKPGEPVSIMLKVDDKKVEVFANDVSVQEIAVDPDRLTEPGLLIEPAGMWGNNTSAVSLSDFSARSLPGRTWVPVVTAEVKDQVLTVPRFEKDDPPRHVLLAENGDVLRGEIEAATDSTFGFRSGLETLTVPRNRVRAVICLQPPDANAIAAPALAPVDNVLEQNIPARVSFGGTGVNQYMSFIKSQVPGLNFKLPDHDDQATAQMLIGGQTVAEALDAICMKFNLRYHVDKDGTIVLDSQADQPATDIVFKSYWLKPAAFPGQPSAEEVLAAKGLTFPAGASAQWQPEAGLLSMLNNAENQAKLAALIGSDFGGTLGSPSYWLLLASGGRLPLAVDAFAGDLIVGHNPAYGTVKVPAAEIYAVRTSPPEKTETTKSLENWRLVNAPEPAIPDGGGQSSPLLGKDALDFKLPLLQGGDFSLGNQKGHVVVLDFWASWCGPCIKSLPGLIDSLASFPADKVQLIGVNQGEPPDQIKHFLDAKGLKLKVALDADQAVGRLYGVDAIPQTIIVGPDGKIAWTQTGYDPDGEAAASATIKHLLGEGNDPPDKPATQ